MYKKGLVLMSLIVVLGMLLSSCTGTTTTPATTKAPETTGGTGAEPVVTDFKSKDPTTWVTVTIGEPDVLDPALDYETAGSEVNQNVYETLYFYKKESAIDFVPMLATDYTLSEDGMTYVFTIRQGVKFHEGQTLTPTDVAYSLQRAVLQSGTSSPSILLTEPILGIGVLDAADMLAPDGSLEDDVDGVKAFDKGKLLEACQKVTSAIVADDAAGTVTVTLAQPYGPFLATLAHTVSSIVNKEWTVANGLWDGDCATWQNYYGIIQENDPIAEMTNGTGPYKLVSWDHATQTVTLEAFDGYWRTEPVWEGAQTGVAKIKTVLIKGISEWGTRFSMFQAGDADWVTVPRANIAQMDPLVGERADFDATTGKFGALAPTDNPSGQARLWYGVPALSRTDMLMNQNIKVDAAGSPLMGSGTFSSRGIPPDFFQNVHVRKAFNYCFDSDTFIKDYLLGEGTNVPYLLPLPGEIGADPTAPRYGFDLAKCQEEFTAATFKDATVWDTGFYFVASYNSGNVARKTMLEILSTTLNTLNPKFTMDVIAMPWASELRFYQAGKLPFFVIGWQEDIHDPHNWYSPYLLGTYGANTFPEADFAMFKDLVNKGVAATDPAARETIYKELNGVVYDYAPFVIGPLAVGRIYFQRWVTGYYNNPLYGGFYYYELGKN